jgi:5-methylcytosine-specific restriction endonuclease McrA
MHNPIDFEFWTAYTYNEYLHSEWWLCRKADAIRRAGYRCQKCGSIARLQVHHVSYLRLGNERDEDLMVLCAKCHEELRK